MLDGARPVTLGAIAPGPAATLADGAPRAGEPMSATLRARLEPALGSSLAAARLHTGPRADAVARAHEARAVTVGSDIYFAEGQYMPDAPQGLALIAHEAAHVVQARRLPAGAPAPALASSWRDAAEEWAAEKKAQASEWYDREKWDVYRAMIAALRGAKGTGIGQVRALLADVSAEMRPVAGTLVDVLDFVLDMVIALLLAVIGMVVGFVEGIAGMIAGLITLAYKALAMAADFMLALAGRPDAFRKDVDGLVRALRALPGALKAAIDAWLEKWRKATPDEQVVMGGELVGQIAAFIATFSVSGAKAGGLKLTVPVPRLAALADGSVQLGVATAAVPTIAPRLAAEGAVIGSQALAMTAHGPTGSSGGGSSGGGGAPRETGPLAGMTDAEFEKAWAELKPAGEHISDLLVHEQQAEALSELRRLKGDPTLKGLPGKTPKGEAVNPSPGYQSAHLAPQSLFITRNGKLLHGYDPSKMVTRLLPTGKGHSHTLFDQFWQREFKAMSGTHTTVAEAEKVLMRAARQSGAFSPAEAESMAALIQNDFRFQLGLKDTDVVRIPGK
ncbi:DUF4157 domain-containing protein [Methylobacterium currus]|uniref:eCIS core domain-containing protein n=1 Tax=Methylobacterium currus TaxID=2051553 RepID=UPI001AEC99BE|nr:DUF4157 domain-containing protein [Methylobacterium currus]